MRQRTQGKDSVVPFCVARMECPHAAAIFFWRGSPNFFRIRWHFLSLCRHVVITGIACFNRRAPVPFGQNMSFEWKSRDPVLKNELPPDQVDASEAWKTFGRDSAAGRLCVVLHWQATICTHML